MTWREYQKKQRVVELGFQFMSYVDEGAGSPVILIHGIPSWGYQFHEMAGELATKSRVLTPDLLGYGFSDKSDTFDRSIAKQTEAIVAFMDALGIESAAMVGHDIGGGVALRLATLFPNRVSKLCVVNGVCYDSWPIELMLQLGHPGVRTLASASSTIAVMTQAMKLGFGRSPSRELLDGILSPYTTEVGKTSLIRCASAMNTNQTTEITHLLPAIEKPTLIVWGIDDPFLPISYGQRLAGDIRGARLMRVADANHYSMYDQPELIGQAIRDFIES